MKIAAGTAAAAAVARGTTVVTSPRVAGAAAHGASAADVLGDGGPDHRRGARLCVYPADLVHGLHLQSWFGLRPHGQRLTRGTGRSRSNRTWCGAVRCRRADALGHRTPRAWCQLPYKLNTVLLGNGFQHTRMGVGKGNVEVANIYYSFLILLMNNPPGESTAAAIPSLPRETDAYSSPFFHAATTELFPPIPAPALLVLQELLVLDVSCTTGEVTLRNCCQLVTRARVFSRHYSSSTQGRPISPTGEHETTI